MCFTDYDPAEFMRSSHPRARKPYRCEECRGPIPAGATYRYIVGRWDGEFDAFKICAACEALREAVAAAELKRGCSLGAAHPPFGGLDEAIRDGEYGFIPGRLAFRRRQRRALKVAV